MPLHPLLVLEGHPGIKTRSCEEQVPTIGRNRPINEAKNGTPNGASVLSVWRDGVVYHRVIIVRNKRCALPSVQSGGRCATRNLECSPEARSVPGHGCRVGPVRRIRVPGTLLRIYYRVDTTRWDGN